jgi:hypothetical protein
MTSPIGLPSDDDGAKEAGSCPQAETVSPRNSSSRVALVITLRGSCRWQRDLSPYRRND